MSGDGLLFDLAGHVAQAVEAVGRGVRIRGRRNRYVQHADPTEPMSSRTAFPFSRHPDGQPPADLRVFVDWFLANESCRERFRWALRDSLDELMDGQRTGRWCYQHLSKTEKTHLGTVVEVNLTKEFEIANGHDLDWRVAGSDLDCKFSKDIGGWEIPMEMYLCDEHAGRAGKADQAALLVWMNDDTSEWAAGLIRIHDDLLRWIEKPHGGPPTRAYNRDNKRRIARERWPDIYWLWGGVQFDLPANTLRQMTPDVRSKILSDTKSGQQRVDSLFREVQGEIIRRVTVLTVGQQDDAPKRVRDARIHLRAEGIVILGHQESHPEIAAGLSLPRPEKGEWVSVRLARVAPEDNRHGIFFGGGVWAVAGPDDDPQPIGELPRILPARPAREGATAMPIDPSADCRSSSD